MFANYFDEVISINTNFADDGIHAKFQPKIVLFPNATDGGAAPAIEHNGHYEFLPQSVVDELKTLPACRDVKFTSHQPHSRLRAVFTGGYVDYVAFRGKELSNL